MDFYSDEFRARTIRRILDKTPAHRTEFEAGLIADLRTASDAARAAEIRDIRDREAVAIANGVDLASQAAANGTDLLSYLIGSVGK